MASRLPSPLFAALALLCVLVSLAPSASGQTAPASTAFSYEVASIKPDKENAGVRSFWRTTANGFSASVSIQNLLMSAYGLRTADQITGLPSWASSDQFAIDAKMDEDTMNALKKLPPKEAQHQRDLMLRAALADRLQLKAHTETRDLPVYALVIAKGGLKMKESAAGTPGGFTVKWNEFSGHGVALESLIYSLTGPAGRVVIDKTGLTGKYDVDLKWTPDGEHNADDNQPDFFTALQEQLGLKLESTTAPVDSLVIDHIERPTEN